MVCKEPLHTTQHGAIAEKMQIKSIKQYNLDLQRHNSQYPLITIITFTRAHDRFLLIDDDVYHIGASLKDLGKKWFAFSKMVQKASTLLQNINKLTNS